MRAAEEEGALLRMTLRRLGAALLVVLGALTLVFFLLHAAPGDPTSAYLHPDIPAEVSSQIRGQLGLDRPLPEQYGRWVLSFVRGDFGYSHIRNQSVARALSAALPNTLLLGGTALVLAFCLGGATGAWQATRGGRGDDAISVVTLVAYSLPGFWVGLLLILLFSGVVPEPLRLPVTGATGIGHSDLSLGGRILERLAHLALPAAALALAPAAGVARHARSSLLEALREPWIRAARARGLPPRSVVRRHGFRNALLPLLSLLGLYLPALLGGTVVIESVFAWPGMGRLLYEAAQARDLPVVMGVTFVYSLLVVAGSLLADLLYGVADPRVRLGARGPS